MSDAADRLARTRLAIIKQIQNREHRPQGGKSERRREREPAADEAPEGEPEEGDGGWFGHVRRAASAWWRHHPAHLGLELATPALSVYASRKPLQFLGIAAAVGAVVVIVRPWRLISLTGLLVAIAKSSQLSSVLLSALSAADYRKDRDPYE
jgi:hypothetical protein